MEVSPRSWYTKEERTNAPLMQGELVYSCPVIVPFNNYDQINDPKRPSGHVDDYDVIIMSHSCQLDRNHCQGELVVVCSFDPPPAYFSKPEYKKMFDPSYMEYLRKGRILDFCLLNKYEGSEDPFPADYLIVDFRSSYIVPYEVVLRAAKKGRRIQLQSPYREYISQAFARFFMRVGFQKEAEIPDFTETWAQLKPAWEKAVEERKEQKNTQITQ